MPSPRSTGLSSSSSSSSSDESQYATHHNANHHTHLTAPSSSLSVSPTRIPANVNARNNRAEPSQQAAAATTASAAYIAEHNFADGPPITALNSLGMSWEYTGVVLGSGTSSAVYTFEASNGLLAAVKFVHTNALSQWRTKQLELETSIWASLDNDNLVKMYSLHVLDSYVVCFSEMLEDGDLRDHLQERGSFSEAETQAVMSQVLSGIKELHAHGIAHRDLKPENIVCAHGKKPVYKVCDFGFAKQLDADMSSPNLTTPCGSRGFVAPEVLMHKYTTKADIYSLGCICFMLLTGKLPSAPNESRDEMYREAGISAEAVRFTEMLLKYQPEERPSASEALAHPWLHPTRNEEVTDSGTSSAPELERHSSDEHTILTPSSMVRGFTTMSIASSSAVDSQRASLRGSRKGTPCGAYPGEIRAMWSKPGSATQTRPLFRRTSSSDVSAAGCLTRGSSSTTVSVAFSSPTPADILSSNNSVHSIMSGYSSSGSSFRSDTSGSRNFRRRRAWSGVEEISPKSRVRRLTECPLNEGGSESGGESNIVDNTAGPATVIADKDDEENTPFVRRSALSSPTFEASAISSMVGVIQRNMQINGFSARAAATSPQDEELCEA